VARQTRKRGISKYGSKQVGVPTIPLNAQQIQYKYKRNRSANKMKANADDTAEGIQRAIIKRLDRLLYAAHVTVVGRRPRLTATE
jgi:hypothetical protein